MYNSSWYDIDLGVGMDKFEMLNIGGIPSGVSAI